MMLRSKEAKIMHEQEQSAQIQRKIESTLCYKTICRLN